MIALTQGPWSSNIFKDTKGKNIGSCLIGKNFQFYNMLKVI